MRFAEPTWTREISAMVLTLMLEAHQRDELPYPLQYLPTGDFDSYLAQRVAATEWIEANMDEPLWNAMDVLLYPDMRIESLVFTGSGADRRHEFHAALRAGSATVIAQQAGQPGTIVFTSCGVPEALVRAVAFLPERQAGLRKPLRVYRDELEREPDSWLDEDTAREDVAYMFHRQRDAWGEIGIFPGSALDSRPTADGVSILWCDYPGDGRYYVENGYEIIAQPMDQHELHERITKGASQIKRTA